jgi:hypothetical protein
MVKMAFLIIAIEIAGRLLALRYCSRSCLWVAARKVVDRQPASASGDRRANRGHSTSAFRWWQFSFLSRVMLPTP